MADNPIAPNGSDMAQLRQVIDEIDNKILKLINRRLDAATLIGKIKKELGDPVVDRARETALLNRLAGINQGPLSQDNLKHIFTEVIGLSREIQQPRRVSYLGPEATFTHIAAMRHFGHFVHYVPQDGIRDIFREVERGACNYGVVPVENTIEGSAHPTLDLFFDSELKICGETHQRVSYDLLSREGSLEDIAFVYSQPQALAMCRGWLNQHLPRARAGVCDSTGRAARKAMEEKGAAAIAGAEAAPLFDLHVLAAGIEDVPRKRSRFLVIGRDRARASGRDKTSLLFVAPNVPGALYHVLEPLAKSGVNMVKLSTSPTLHSSWDDFFFADLEGHVTDARVRESLEKMKSLCLYFKWLGSYPEAGGGRSI